MSQNKEINLIINDAIKLSRRGFYEDSARQYYDAACLAEVSLGDETLKNKCLYLYHIERLKDSKGKTIDDIDAITNILVNLSSSEDDRLEDRVGPIFDFFLVLKYCINDEIDQVRQLLDELRVKTEKESVSQVQSITHLVCESLHIKESIKECREGLKDNTSKKLLEEITSLEDCIIRHKESSYLNPKVKGIFQEYYDCICSIKESDIIQITLRCINKFVGYVTRNRDLFSIISDDIISSIASEVVDGIRKDERNFAKYTAINNGLLIAETVLLITGIFIYFNNTIFTYVTTVIGIIVAYLLGHNNEIQRSRKSTIAYGISILITLLIVILTLSDSGV